MVPTQPRNHGIPVDPAAIDRQLALRGASARQLAEKSGVDESLISRARRGHGRITEKTLRKLVAALQSMPLLPGAELIIGSGTNTPPRDAA